MPTQLKCIAVLLGIVGLAGCFSGEDPRFADLVRVNGTVTFENQPVANGSIQFTSPEDRMRGTEISVAIVDGKFTTRLAPGNKVVTVNAPQSVGPVDETGSQKSADLIPPKYNTESGLTVEITQETTTLDFDLSK